MKHPKLQKGFSSQKKDNEKAHVTRLHSLRHASQEFSKNGPTSFPNVKKNFVSENLKALQHHGLSTRTWNLPLVLITPVQTGEAVTTRGLVCTEKPQ